MLNLLFTHDKAKRCADITLCAFLFTTILMSPVLRGESVYSPGGWATLHRDAGNRRNSDTPVTGNRYQTWTALAGATVLTAPVTSPDGQTLYLTTGLGKGQSNLHAYSIQGELQWQSPAWTDAEHGIDPCAILSSPVVDAAGDIYISDCNQLFAFRADGENKWTTPLPTVRDGDWLAAAEHPVNAFTTAAFLAGGQLIGITNFGDVVVVDRANGRILNRPYRLPAEISPRSEKHSLPDALFGDGLMDPAFRDWAWQVIFAGNMRSANTPAVSQSGRVFVVGSSDEPGIGALFALDIDTSAESFGVSVAFATKIGIGSGSSPALSPSGEQVYVSDEEGWLYAIDSHSGKQQWKLQTAAAAGAAAVGADGTIYALQEHPAAALVAISPEGAVRWESNLESLVQDLPSAWLLGDPVAIANGNPTVTADAVLVPVLYSYPVPFTDINLPVHSALAAIDKRTGRAMKELVSLADDSSGITAVLPDGTLVNSLGATMTSALEPLSGIAELLLPGELNQLQATGGIQVSLPEGGLPPARE